MVKYCREKKIMFYSGNNSKTKIIYTLILMYHRIENLENGPEGISELFK
jgi:hypothetical protein